LFGAVAIAAVAIAGNSATAGGTKKIESKVTLGYQACGVVGPPPCDMGSYLYGEVKSKKNTCVAGRVVKLREEDGDVFATTETDGNGEYKTFSGPAEPNQEVDALVTKSTFGNNGVCLKDVSKPVLYFIAP
jgi:hypothetical protein